MRTVDSAPLEITRRASVVMRAAHFAISSSVGRSRGLEVVHRTIHQESAMAVNVRSHRSQASALRGVPRSRASSQRPSAGRRDTDPVQVLPAVEGFGEAGRHALVEVADVEPVLDN